MTDILTERDVLPATAPRDDLGKPIEPNPYFHDWDQTPHAIYTVGIGHVELGDVILGGTHQVEGKGRAEQRGVPAVRLDLEYVVGQTMEGSARLILPIDHQLEVKRYYPEAMGRYHFAWVKLDNEDDAYPAGLIPDYGSNAQFCCAIKDAGVGSDELNPHGFDLSQVMCDGCVDSWATDHEVIRHNA